MSSSAPKLCVADVSMTFKTPTGAFHALAPVTLSIPQGRFVSLIGPSGCGKSTIFNIIAGLLEPTGGRVLIDGIDATGTIGRVGYMLQKDLLLPWRTVLDNEPFGALDAQTKLRMQEWLMQLWSDFNKTVLFVTHDVEEAIYLSDEVHVMGTRPGRIIATIPVPLARPRIRGSVLSGEFLAIKERCLELLHLQPTASEPVNEAA